MCLQHVNGKFKINVSDDSTLFFPNFLSAQNITQVFECKIIWKWSEGRQKFLRVSRRFELLRVRVTKGKITVNRWRRSRGNWFWFEVSARFELARVCVIRSQLYVQNNNSIKEIKAWYEVASYTEFLWKTW